MRINVPQEAILRLDDIKVAGGGPFAGFLLMEEGSGIHRDLLLYGVLPQMERMALDISGFEGTEDGTGYIIPAGSYRLYLLADGKTTTAPIRFEGLTGKTGLEPTRKVHYEVRELTSRVTTDPAKSVYSAGDVGRIVGKEGLAFRALVLEGKAHTHGDYGLCLYNGRPREPVPYMPGCPTAYGWTNGVTAVLPDYRIATYALTYPLPAKKWAQGVWYASGSLPETIGSMGFWLGLE